MEFKLSEVLDSIDFYASTLNRPSWYSSKPLRKAKDDVKKGRREKRNSKGHVAS